MKITAFQNRNLTILAIAFGLLFFGFNAAEQHFTAFYQTIGMPNLAFQALALLYASIILGNLFGPNFVSRFGIKTSLFLGFLSYTGLVFGITLKIPWLIYLFSICLGMGAGVIGIARVDFLRLTSPIKNRGEYAGAIESVRTLGGFIGIISVSVLLAVLGISQIFLLLGGVMVLGCLLILLLKDVKEEKSAPVKQNFQLMLRLGMSPKLLFLLPYGVAGGFLLGLVLGTVPVVIQKQFGLEYVGIITSLFHLATVPTLLGAGYLSDLKGRFVFIYLARIVSIVAAVIFLIFSGLPVLALVMILLGLGGSLGGGAFSALMLDHFEEKIKEASATLGMLELILGVVPAFLLPQIMSQNELFALAIALSVLGIICLRLFQVKYARI